MCGRCAPHGQCAPGYAGALEIGSKPSSTHQASKAAVHPPGQQGRRPPARPARLKRGLEGNRNVHRRSEVTAPLEEQDSQYTSGQKEFLEPLVLS